MLRVPWWHAERNGLHETELHHASSSTACLSEAACLGGLREVVLSGARACSIPVRVPIQRPDGAPYAAVCLCEAVSRHACLSFQREDHDRPR